MQGCVGLVAVLWLLVCAPAARADVTWLCHPGIANDPCEIAQDTTIQKPGGGGDVVTPPRSPSARRAVDCFYVYPTVSGQLGLNATKARDPELLSIAKYQAAGFSQACRMFAPVYRQITLAGIPAFGMGTGPDSPAGKAYGDVLEAWRHYLEHDNGGRGVVLLSHSQGTLMLRRLIRSEIEAHADQRRLLAGGVVLGANVTVRAGEATGGDFAQVPICTERGQFGCLVAYSTYASDPGPLTFFGRDETDFAGASLGSPRGPGYEVACTDPGRLSAITAPVGVTVPSEPFAPGPIAAGIAISSFGQPPTAPTTWVRAPDRFAGACKDIGGADVYRYDPVGPQSRRPPEFPPAWGTHLVDMNLGLERLVRIAQLQAQGWLDAGFKVRRVVTSRRTGHARLELAVPGSGSVSVARSRTVRGARRTLDGPGPATLRIVARGPARRTLQRRRNVRVSVRVTYASGDGHVATRTRRVRLERR